jgi:sugar O-acyltransferase (sialic acid O-acetyltransferase NeuD family)
VILGTTAYAHDILDIVDALNHSEVAWEVVGFLDDARGRGTNYQGIEVLGGIREASKLPGVVFVNSIGSDRSYRKRADVLAMTGLPMERFATLIHPLAIVSRRAQIGLGTCVNGFARLASGVKVGNHVWLGPGCSLDHDTTVEDYAVVGAGSVLTGGVRVRASAFIGAQAALRTRVEVGEKAQVGLGAIVIADVASGTTVVGNPARSLARSPGSNGADKLKPHITPTVMPPRGDK